MTSGDGAVDLVVAQSVLLQLHIPKTAGMALSDCVLEMYKHSKWTEEEGGRLVAGLYYVPIGINDYFVPDERARRILVRNDVRAVVGHFYFGLHEWVNKPCQYVTILRDPVDRVVSLYHQILRWEHEWLHEEVVSRGLSLYQFVNDLNFTEVDNGQTRRIAGGAQPCFGECDRELLNRAQRNLTDNFAVAGLMERLGESITVMKRRLNWSKLPDLRQKNVNKARPRAEELPPETLEAIRDRNQLDLELYAFAERRLQEQIDSCADA